MDFGQYKLKDMYGINRRVYFFVTVLSYSNLRFYYFSAQPFTSKTAILAHQYAFKFFGGRPQTIMNDQDRVFVVSENLGNIIFVKEFGQYVREIGYSVVLCKPYDPQTKGRAEQAVRFVKEQFLEGRESEWQLNELKKLHWIDDTKNLFIVGNCGSGKTELATTIGSCCLDSGYKVFYIKADELILTLKTKEANPKAKKTYEYMKSCDLFIVDEFMYIVPSPEELTLLYRSLTFLSEAQSIIFITNRELSDWTKTTEDKHLMQTLLSRITLNSQILKL